VADTQYRLHVEREDGELLVIEGLDIVRAFIASDPSAQPGGYDSLAGKGDRERISAEDVTTVNKTMRARAKMSYWQPVLDGEQQWLTDIPDELDIIEANDETWQAANGDQRVSKAIAECIRPHIALARSTKVLHLKRPFFFPVLDELVIVMMGVNLPNDPTVDERIAIAQKVTSAIRREGRRNIEPLQRIQIALKADKIALSLVRIFDIALWFSHPAAGVEGAKRELVARLRG
jgi:hypothetical protein